MNPSDKRRMVSTLVIQVAALTINVAALIILAIALAVHR